MYPQGEGRRCSRFGRFVVAVRKIADDRGGRNTFMRILVEEACTALTDCFNSLGSDMKQIKELLSEDLFAYWKQRQPHRKAKKPAH